MSKRSRRQAKIEQRQYVGLDVSLAETSIAVVDEGGNPRAKADNLAGLRLADLVLSPIGRHVLGKPDKDDWSAVGEKFRRSSKGKTEGFGLVVLP